MVDELVIHLGDRKTGSTSIQSTLARKLYKTDVPIVFPAQNAHRTFAIQLEKSVDSATKSAERIARALKETEGGVGAISTERFEVVDPAHLAALFDGPFKPWRDNFRLIGYLRPHVERFLSAFAERSKNGSFSGSIEEFADLLSVRPLLDYAPRVSAWQAEFGDRYNVRPFIRDRLEGGDVVRDFFTFMLGDRTVTLTTGADRNASLSLEDLVLVRYMHARLDALGVTDSNAKVVLGKQLGQILNDLPATQSTRLQIHAGVVTRLQKVFRADAVELDAIAFDGTPMTDRLESAGDTALAEPQSLAPEDWLSPETRRIADGYCEFVGRLMKADPRGFHWAAQPDDLRSPQTRKKSGKSKRAAPKKLSNSAAAKAAFKSPIVRRLAVASASAVRRLRRKKR